VNGRAKLLAELVLCHAQGVKDEAKAKLIVELFLRGPSPTHMCDCHCCGCCCRQCECSGG
jgi:hypothetical protein